MPQGSPGSAPPLAAVITPPPDSASRVLAEVAMWFARHPGGPPLGDRNISLEVRGRGHAQKMASLSAIAKWLDVRPDFRNGVWFVQRRFGEPGNSVTLDAHYTPDHDAAFAALQAAGRYPKPVAS
jgi:hypothetical protein